MLGTRTLGWQNGRRRRIQWAMASPVPRRMFKLHFVFIKFQIPFRSRWPEVEANQPSSVTWPSSPASAYCCTAFATVASEPPHLLLSIKGLNFYFQLLPILCVTSLKVFKKFGFYNFCVDRRKKGRKKERQNCFNLKIQFSLEEMPIRWEHSKVVLYHTSDDVLTKISTIKVS